MKISKTQKDQKKPQRKFSKPTVAIKHKKVFDKLTENGGNLAMAIRETGLYSEEVALNPHKITESKTWQEIIADELPDSELTEKHKELLNATRINHMFFALGPKTNAEKAEGEDVISDDEIREMLAEVNCKVRRIVHGETQRHVYFWSNDNKSRKEALDMAYKLKGRYGDETTPRSPGGNTYNFLFSGPVQEKIKLIEGEIKDFLIKKPDAKKD